MKNTTRNMLGCLGLIVLALLSGACKEPPVSVPNVVGMVQAAAEAAIVQAKLTVGAVTIEYHTMAPRGQVVSQNPAPGSRVAPQSAVDITVAGAYSGGDGSSDAPYLISVVQDLLDLANPDNKADWDKHFLMTTDIDMTGVTECTPIGNDIEPFEGTLEGNGYAIRNLVIELPAQDYVGLFGYLHGGTLQNIGLEGGSVVGDEKVGGLVGFSVDGTVSNCYATGAVTGTITVGGLIGYSDSESPVMQCYATGVVTAPYYAGGLIGRNFGPVTLCYATGAVAGDQYAGGLMAENRAPVSDCYATGTVTGDSGVGGLVGINYLGTVSDCYATGMVTGNFSVGGLVGDNDSGSVTASFWDTETTGTAISAGGEGKTTAEMMTESTFTDAGWDFTEVWYMLGGESYPYLQASPVTGDGSYSGGCGTAGAPYLISTVQDLLDLANLDNIEDWDKHFLMTNDIDMADVTGFTPIGNDDTWFTGIFDGGEHAVQNLGIDLPLSDYVGVFGYLGTDGRIQNLCIEGGAMTGFWDVGGLAGHNSGGTIIDCSATSAVTGVVHIGGLVGMNYEGTITDCYATGVVAGGSHIGGLVGCSVDGTVSNCYATGAVTGAITVGGLIGDSDSESPVMQCYATGVVTAPQHAGGLIGRNFGPVTLCYATGAVAGDQYAGGLMAENRAPVSDCYATGTVTGYSDVGGLVGINYLGAVSDCYATGMVTGNSSVGGLVGDNDSGSVTASFWDTETSGTAISAGGEGKTTAEMMAETTFTDVGWDFSDVWYMLEGGSYPFLVGNPEVK